MITDNTRATNALCVCPECKNSIDLSPYPKLATGMIIECNHCGMTLAVKDITSSSVQTEIVDEGK